MNASTLAYLDAASGGMIAALAAGGLAGVRVAARSAWQGLRRRRDETDETGTEDDRADDTSPAV